MVFSLIKIVLWLVFFFAWLFGKSIGNEIRTTFRDWFPFLYFIYLVFFVVQPDKVQVQKFNFIDYTIYFLFIISIYKDVFRGFRYFIRRLPVGSKFLKILDKMERYLFEKKIEDVAEFLLAIVLIGLVYFQITHSIPTINLVNKSNVELLGFIVGIFSMYGIYIGFLQYLAGDIKSDTYLGKSKVNYLIEKSFWYYITQSKIFILMLLTTIIVPIVIKLNTVFIKELTILWQTSYMLLLVVYIFLLSMSLYIIRVALLMKSKDDENLKYNMKKQIQQGYTEIFWLIYCNRDRYKNDFIKNKLIRDFAKLDANEYEEFVTNIFDLDYFDNRNLYWTISNQIETGFELTKTQKFHNRFLLDDRPWLETYQDKNEYDLRQEWKSFYKYVRTFIFGKWMFLKQYENSFSAKSWKDLILGDLNIIDKIVKNDPTSESLKIEYPDERVTRFVQSYRTENVREFLFNLLIEKEEINLNGILGDIEEEIRNFEENETDQFYRYTLFNQAKKIILATNINYRITESFLDRLWKTRNDIIRNFSWFDQFGEQHLMSNFKILYVQWILSGATTSHLENRFNFERKFPMKVSNSILGKLRGKKKQRISVQGLKWEVWRKKERLGYFCREYLILTDKLDSIFEKTRSYGKQNNAQVSVEYLLHSGKVHLSDVIDNISVSSLLRLEWILRRNYYHYTREPNYTSRTFFDTMTSNSRYYWSGGDGILEFYIVKIIDNFYYDLYQDREFMDGFKRHLESQLNSLDKSIEKYVESIGEKVSGLDNISILQKAQIISRLNDILFGQNNSTKTSQKRKYRYK